MSGPLGTSGGGAAGVTSVTAGNGITVTGTTTPTIAASLAAGTGVSIAGTTTLTVTNTGVTSIVAGTGISISGATGAVTVTNSATPVTSVTGTAPIVSSGGTTPAISVTMGTPGVSAVGDTATAGTASSVARSDHKHGRESSAAAGASAVGDTASAGVATTIALSDHRHSREAFGTPIAVTGGATAASGSATTVARSDHAHSTASLPVLLVSTTLSASTSILTISSIPQTFNNLWIIAYLRSNGSVAYDTLKLNFNGDTGNNYSYSGGSGTGGNDVGFIAGASAFAANVFGANQMVIANYSNTTMIKSVSGVGTAPLSTTAYSMGVSTLYGNWRSTAAITSVSFSSSSGYSLVANSYVAIYGLP